MITRTITKTIEEVYTIEFIPGNIDERILIKNKNWTRVYRGVPAELSRIPVELHADIKREWDAKRTLNSNEYRSQHGHILSLSDPDIYGYKYSWLDGSDSPKKILFSETFSRTNSELGEAAVITGFCLKWHHKEMLPLLEDDWCYEFGQRPRRMKRDEVRGPDGFPCKMHFIDDGWLYITLSSGIKAVWRPPVFPENFDVSAANYHPANVRGQLFRIQTFWNAEHDLLKLADDGTSKLKNNEFVTPQGDVERMYVEFELLYKVFDEKTWPEHGKCAWTREKLVKLANEDKRASGWPRALAYFDLHARKQGFSKLARELAGTLPPPEAGRILLAGSPERKRVTDISNVTVNGKIRIHFNFAGWRCGYGGDSDLAKRFPEMNKDDRDLIERRYAESLVKSKVPSYKYGQTAKIVSGVTAPFGLQWDWSETNGTTEGGEAAYAECFIGPLRFEIHISDGRWWIGMVGEPKDPEQYARELHAALSNIIDGPVVGLVNGLAQVLKVLNVSLFAQARWLQLPNKVLGGQTPLDALKAGRLDEVITEARGVGATAGDPGV